MVAHGNYVSTDSTKTFVSWRNYFKLGAEAPDVYATRWSLLGSPSICLPKATAPHQKTRAVCENQLISSHRFAERMKQCRIQNSERLLRTPVDQKDGSRKIASSREGAVSVDRRAEDWVVPLPLCNQIFQ